MQYQYATQFEIRARGLHLVRSLNLTYVLHELLALDGSPGTPHEVGELMWQFYHPDTHPTEEESCETGGKVPALHNCLLQKSSVYYWLGKLKFLVKLIIEISISFEVRRYTSLPMQSMKTNSLEHGALLVSMRWWMTFHQWICHHIQLWSVETFSNSFYLWDWARKKINYDDFHSIYIHRVVVGEIINDDAAYII